MLIVDYVVLCAKNGNQMIIILGVHLILLGIDVSSLVF